jgi:nucleotide-binding universal stress UspA family protein
MPDRPLLLCYDGSDDAKHAIAEAAALFGSRRALVVSVWQDVAAVPSLAWVVPMPGLDDLFEAARENAARVAAEGVQAAVAAGFDATPLVSETAGPVWAAIVEAAETHDVAAIVLGSRGLSAVKTVLIGSVSNGVVHHARRPTVVVRRAEDE